MRRILLCVVVVAALGACGGKSNKKTVAQGADQSSTTVAAAAASGGDATGAQAPSQTPSSVASSPTTAKAGAKSAAGTGAAANAAPTTAPKAGGTTGSNTGSGSGSGSTTQMTSTPAGRYHYAITGTSSMGSPPPGADLVVDKPQGTTQHTKLTTQSQAGSSSTDTTTDSQPDGLHLVDLTTNTGGMTMSFHPQPAPRIQPQPMTPGSSVSFSMTSTDGKTVADVKVTVVALDQKVTLGDGSTANTVQAQVDTTLHCAAGQQCAFTGTLKSTRWLRSDGLTVKDHSVTDGTYSGGFGNIPVKSDTTALVDKGTPA